MQITYGLSSLCKIDHVDLCKLIQQRYNGITMYKSIMLIFSDMQIISTL